MNTQTITAPITWYARPTPTHAAEGFAAKLGESIALLREAADLSPCVFANSLSAEDIVIFHLIASQDLPIPSIALDTGKLPKQTIDLWQRIETVYSKRIERVAPNEFDVAELKAMHADSGIYESKVMREQCCELRKTKPLQKALIGKRAWVTGLRRAQSAGRASVVAKGFDSQFQLHKFNPLFAWSDSDVWYFIENYQIPFNSLYESGFASIGCEPCTRPIRAHEHPRAGRWWWEQTDATTISSECGIHVASTHASLASTAQNNHSPDIASKETP